MTLWYWLDFQRLRLYRWIHRKKHLLLRDWARYELREDKMPDFFALLDELTPMLGADRALAIITMLRTAENRARVYGLSTCNSCQGTRNPDDWREYQHTDSCPVDVLSRPALLTERQVKGIARGITDKAMRRKMWNEEQAQAFLNSVEGIGRS